MQLNGSSNYVQLSAGITNSTPGVELDVLLSIPDMSNIRENLALAISEESTYLSLTSATVTDTSGIDVVAIESNAALQVCTYVEDITSPRIEAFDVHMIDGRLPLILTLYFSESINIRSLDICK